MTLVQSRAGDRSRGFIAGAGLASIHAVAGVGVVVTDFTIINKCIRRAVIACAITNFGYVTFSGSCTAFIICTSQRPIILIGSRITDQALMVRVFRSIGDAGFPNIAKPSIANAVPRTRFAKPLIFAIAWIRVAGIYRVVTVRISVRLIAIGGRIVSIRQAGIVAIGRSLILDPGGIL